MTALPQDAVADLQQRIADLERQLETAVNERDAAIERQTASALVNFRLKNELRAVTDREKASAEILNAIANTQGDAEHALQRIAEVTQHFFNAPSVTIRIAEGDEWVQNVRVGPSGHLTGAQPASASITRGTNLPATVYQENRQIHIPDLDNIDPSMAHWPVTAARAAGIRTVCGSPLRRGGKAIGALIVYRDRLAPFTEDELALQQSFADQAVIAIENARLFNETGKALARQTATSDILRVISGSPTDVQPVFDEIVLTAARLLRCDRAFIQRHDGGSFWTVAAAGQGGPLPITVSNKTPVDPEANFPSRAIIAKETLYLPDWSVIELPEFERRIRDLHGNNSSLYMPLLRDGECIGLLAMVARQVNLFGESEIKLAESFRDQALIAIENTRLFTETQEALERQTATADILKVIADSPSDVQPVFKAIASSANALLGGLSTAVHVLTDDTLHLVAFTPTNPAGDANLQASYPRSLSALPWGAALRTGEIVLVGDTEVEWATFPSFRDVARMRGFRSILRVPMLRDGTTIGVINVTRTEPGQFAPHHVRLLQTFADQAVIAIENTRLFNETKEALERQTATADILKVIASSPSDVQPVFEAIVNSGALLFEPCAATITTLKDGELHWNATAGRLPGFDVARARAIYPLRFDPERSPSSRAILERRVVEIPDVEAPDTPDSTRNAAAAGGFRSITFVPLVDQHEGIGTIIFTHQQPGFKFSDKQLALVQTFADQAVIAIQNTRLFNETKEALERQTATAEILKVIASSPSDVQPVFEAIAERATRLVSGFSTAVHLLIDGQQHLKAFTRISPEADAVLQAAFPRPLTDLSGAEQIRNGEIFEITDTELEFAQHPSLREMGRKRGYRSLVIVPLLREREPIGLINVTRREAGRFASHHLDLLRTFADQAVIAIENARLFNETKEALERQTATADILKVIASSPSDVQPVFEAIAERSNRLVGGLSTAVYSLVDGAQHLMAFTRTSPTADAALQALFPRPLSEAPWGEQIRHGEIVHIADIEVEGAPPHREVARLRGWRSFLLVPLLRDRIPIGLISVTRKEPGTFAAHHVQLLQTFADQAVIAIENTRLFNEVQERTVELTEALEQQTATAEVLGVISSSAGDLAPVFDAMLGKAMQLCSANFGVLNTYDGHAFHTAATYGLPPAYDEYRRKQPLDYGPGTAPTRLLDGEPFVEITDLLESEAYRSGEQNRRALVDIGGARCLLAVPLLRDERVVGNVMIFRQENRPFSEKQIALLQQFAAQAVIAIENTRLLRELRESTEDLSESLQQQTATSEVLQIISASPGDLTPVFDKMLENATRVCGAEFGSMLLVEGDTVRQAALYNAPPAFAAVRANRVSQIHPISSIAAAIRSKQVVQVEDMRIHPGYLNRNPTSVQLVELGGARTIAVVPMLRDDEVIGLITVYRQEVRPFGDKQIDLLTNFARQAVIAIENARLLRELRQRTDDLSESLQQQTATSEVLQIISSSPGDLAPVFDKMLENATRVCGAGFGSMLLVEDELVRQAALYNAPAALAEVRVNKVFRPHPQSALAAAIRTKQVCQVADMRTQPGYLERSPATVEFVELGGVRTAAWVPMVRDNETIGVITIYRQEVHPFDDKQIELVRNFAKQAVIAIENARLLRELRQRTDDLSKSLDDLRTAQDRLIQTEKLASLGQLTAGIAHEIKNPLNFVNNFAALSAELTDELKDVLKPAVLDETIRAEVDEVTGLLKDNLSKVVQHGKRADSIVKNMLLHSREGSGEHRPADVNALVDESLNLAYHGARAEKPQFNVTLQRDFDPAAGMIEVFPQEITRVLLNLISNGFYAVTRRKADNGAAEFEPLVTATTRGGDDHVEIRIRDNGTGIPPEVKEKMFNPFFTTKPAGEGTGLGLSMSHDIIVKQHGGTIEVETEPGAFTEFRLVLPRASLAGKAGGNR